MGRKFAILGQGGIGLTFTMIAERQGAEQVVGIDLEEYRCRKSTVLGATHTINASNESVLEAAQEITSGDMFDVVVDASGDPEGLGIAVDLVKNQGQIVSFSLVDPSLVTFDHRKWMSKNIQMNATVIAATDEPIQEIRDIVALKERGWIDPGVLKTHEMKFEEAQEAFEMYRLRQDGVIKVAMSL
jgi:threonine dehydrogenase-like Zn-dependent dehydrogenase